MEDNEPFVGKPEKRTDGYQLTPLQRFIAFVLRVKPMPREDLIPTQPAIYNRADMDAAINAILVPHLRAMGFTGSMPYLRRERDGAYDILDLQFSKYGGAFDIWLARFPLDGITYDGEHIPPEKARVFYMKDQFQLGSHQRRIDYDHYDFARRHPEHVAREVVEDLDRPETWAKVDRLKPRSLIK